jgi:hypothetical protein
LPSSFKGADLSALKPKPAFSLRVRCAVADPSEKMKIHPTALAAVCGFIEALDKRDHPAADEKVSFQVSPLRARCVY